MVAVHVIPGTPEIKAGGPQAPGQTRKVSETLPQKQNTNKRDGSSSRVLV
jgi:hypothetical protein